MIVAVLGVGLIGGSFALAARERLGAVVRGFDPGGLEVALERAVVDQACASVAEACRGADLVLAAAPVGVLGGVVDAALGTRTEALVTDVGSVKRGVLRDDPRFIGGHPLAGAETAGVEHARADLFDGATWYLTPTPRTEGVRYERLHRWLADLGARPVAIEAEVHDRVLASVSHLPHVVANVLALHAAEALASGSVPVTGPSFRDMTRVAGANSAIWGDIYRANADLLARAIDDAIARLEEAREALRGDVAGWNDAARAARDRLRAAQPGGALHELRVAVPNRPGIVAEIALALGRAGVNIADMTLDPAPDRASGSVALWVAGDEAAQRATAAIEGLGLSVARP